MLRFLSIHQQGHATKQEMNNQYWHLIAKSNLDPHQYQKFIDLLGSQRAAEAIFTIIESENDNMLQAWLNRGADPNVVIDFEDNRGRCYKTCPLLEAIRRKHEPMVRTLLSGGADLAALDKHGINLTLAANQSGSLGIMAIIENHKTKEAEEVIYQRLSMNFSNSVRIVNWPTEEKKILTSTRTYSI